MEEVEGNGGLNESMRNENNVKWVGKGNIPWEQCQMGQYKFSRDAVK
jgi:hypothetical protein